MLVHWTIAMYLGRLAALNLHVTDLSRVGDPASHCSSHEQHFGDHCGSFLGAGYADSFSSTSTASLYLAVTVQDTLGWPSTVSTKIYSPGWSNAPDKFTTKCAADPYERDK